MRVCAISDLHCQPGDVPDPGALPRCDLLVVAGDLTMRGTVPDVEAWVAWAQGAAEQTGCRTLLWIRGNHDHWIGQPAALRGLPECAWEIPEQRAIRVEGRGRDRPLWVWGSSASCWIPEPLYAAPERLRSWHGWAWRHERSEIWAGIPAGLDLLITHSPPAGVLDRVEEGHSAGDPELSRALCAPGHPPRAHVFGHIHEAGGQGDAPWGTHSINAAARDRRYRIVRPEGVSFDL